MNKVVFARESFYAWYFSIFSLVLVLRLRRKIKCSRQCLTTIPNAFVKNTPLRVVFSTLFSALENLVKHSLLCLIYYVMRSKTSVSCRRGWALSYKDGSVLFKFPDEHPGLFRMGVPPTPFWGLKEEICELKKYISLKETISTVYVSLTH